jgi:hypothetical protein
MSRRMTAAGGERIAIFRADCEDFALSCGANGW